VDERLIAEGGWLAWAPRAGAAGQGADGATRARVRRDPDVLVDLLSRPANRA
jgi:hypothetical protein